MLVSPDPNDVGSGSDEAARWVAEALANARTWFPDLPETELGGPLEQAFELANQVDRGEREFHEVFEAELRRAVEERDVLGAAGSVLPGGSAEPPQAFPAHAEAPVDPSESADGPTIDDDPVEPPAEPSAEDEAARLFVLEVGALRFHNDVSPKEIQDELGVTEEYYAASMRWLLDQVDHALEGDYPSHVDRARMARFAAGLESIEDRFAVERHVRECAGCATYLADLLDAVVPFVEGPQPDPNENAGLRSGSARRPRDRRPVMTVKASELRRYSRASEDRQPTVASAPAYERRTRSPRTPEGSRSGHRRLVYLLVCAAAAVALAVTIAALSGGGQGADAQKSSAPPKHPTPAVAQRKTQARQAARRRARHAARERAERRARREQAARRAARAKQRRATEATREPTPPDTVAPAPTPSAPPTVAPAPPSGGEFGLEP